MPENRTVGGELGELEGLLSHPLPVYPRQFSCCIRVMSTHVQRTAGCNLWHRNGELVMRVEYNLCVAM